MQLSLTIFLLIIAALGGLFVWWQSNRFEWAIQGILFQGGSVSYDSQMVAISFAPWMPTIRESSQVKRYAALEEKVEYLYAIYDNVRYLACRRPLLCVEFASEEQARVMQEHFIQYPVDARRVELAILSPQHSVVVFASGDISIAKVLSGLPFNANRTTETNELDKPKMHRVCLVIPLSISPKERFDLFEGPICDLFDEDEGGDVIGSGTFRNQDGITCCDITIDVAHLSTMNRIAAILRSGGAPSDSIIKFIDEEKDEVSEVRLEDWVDLK